ncbi:hypothetical protein PG996_004910 [Apiospora saccharicola]|uniref:Uncharacterized protein n=1 Tax=Apiospora saccharicola TaxID=335842 RepID=A0ABR1VK85_9PEZI
MANQQPPSGSTAPTLPEPVPTDYFSTADYCKALGCISFIRNVIKKINEALARIMPVVAQNLENLAKELYDAEEALKALKEIPSRNEDRHASVSAELSSTSSAITELLELWKEFLSKANAVREKASAPDAMAVHDVPAILASSVPATHSKVEDEGSPCIKRTIAMKDVVWHRDGAFYLEDDICIMRCPGHLVLKGRRKVIHEISKPGEWLKKLLAKGSVRTRGKDFDGADALEYLVIKGK